MPSVGELIRCTDGSWMVTPPQRCPRGQGVNVPRSACNPRGDAAADMVAGAIAARRAGDLTSAVAIETAVARLEHVRHVLRHVVSVCCGQCGDDMDHYEDGRTVASHIRFGDGTGYLYARTLIRRTR